MFRLLWHQIFGHPEAGEWWFSATTYDGEGVIKEYRECSCGTIIYREANDTGGVNS